MGSISGVQARFKQIIPNLFVLGCVCHSFNLCSSAAAQKLPRSLEDMIRSIYNYFAHSSNRVSKLQEFQAFVELKPHKMFRPSQTRWLSLQAAVDRVLENWTALTLFFTNECFEDNLQSVQNILGQLQTPIYKVYFTFLSYVLELVNKLNVEFQAEKPKLHLLLSRVRALYRSILRNYIEIKYLDRISLQNINPSDPRLFLKLEQVYFGAQTDLLLSNKDIDPKELHSFRTHALSYYVLLAEQLKKRFNFDDEVLLFMSWFNPAIAVSGDISNIATQSFKLFPQLVNDLERLNIEWRLVADLSELKAFKEETLETFWTHIFQIKNDLKDLMFPNLTKLVKGLLCLPHSSAAAERVFSQLNLLKNKMRNKLHVDTCESILHAKELLDDKTCHNWQSSQALLKRKPQYDSNANKQKIST
ncbi:uncharacterized protein [Venturia canescens]|uniref:uncharacterized protein n=1 Tax=Venturia canescens TaxID=32260 RepID=UPI001C9C9E65|nr:uncharacterized protein LOC122407813 [Venturia canescens]